MAKKILYIVLGALLIFGLLFVLWSWWSSPSKQSQTNGTFGTASSTQGTVGVGGENTNGQVPLGSNSTNGTIPLNSSGNTVGETGAGGSSTNGGSTNGGSTNGGSVNSLSTNGSVGTGGVTIANVSGVHWLAGSGSSAINGQGFNPDSINGVSGGLSGSVPTIATGITGGGTGSGTTLLTALAGASLAGLFSCGILLTSAAPVVATGPGSATAATAGALAATTGALPSGATAISTVTGVPVTDLVTHNQQAGLAAISYSDYLTKSSSLAQQTAKTGQGFLGCLANTVAKVALQQITTSVVNWINSGFNGQPSFVTNYDQFFTNVADLAAGQFIQGSGLAFLCSPFAPQIKIAIAQSYANRGAQSCSLTSVIKNVNSFMSGNFAQGGWGGLVSFTTVPTNNPYGAYAYAQAGLASAQSAALTNASRNISPTGFLNLQKQTCNGVSTINANNPGFGIAPSAAQASQAAKSNAVCQPGCTCSVTTPGGAIATALDNTENSPLNQLGVANDIDQIISALTTQLLTRTLQNGLTSLSQPATSYQTPQDLAAQTQAQSMLADMENNIGLAQQLGSIYQGSIGDIQNAQSGLNSLANCWSAQASSTTLTSDQQTQAAQNASTAGAQFQSLESQIGEYNNGITNVNNEIALLQQFITQISSVASDADVQTVASNYAAAQAATPFVAQTDLTTAQQNRTTLQTQMATIETSTQTGLAQCEAYPNAS